MKASTVLFLYAAVLVLAGVGAFLSAPKGANAKTALIIPGACALVVAACALMARRAGGPRSTWTLVGMVVAVLFGLLCAWRAMAAGDAVASHRKTAAAYETEVSAGRLVRSDEARSRYFREAESPDHDKAYLRNLLWALAGVSLVAAAATYLRSTAE